MVMMSTPKRPQDAGQIAAELEKLESRILPWLVNEVGSVAEAEDIWMATREQALRERASCHTSFGAWVRRIARNRMIDLLRKRGPQGRHVPITGHADEIAAGTPTGPATRQMREMVRKIVGAWEERDRTILWLKYEEGLSAEEIAAVVEVSKTNKPLTTDNVNQELHRLRERFAREARAAGLLDDQRHNMRR